MIIKIVGKCILSGTRQDGSKFSYRKAHIVSDTPTTKYELKNVEGSFTGTLDCTQQAFDSIAVGNTYSGYYFDRDGLVAMFME